MKRFCAWLPICVLAILAGPAAAQRGPGFPQAGDLLPEITVFDEAGREFSTKRLRGQYSVLVFGCLT